MPETLTVENGCDNKQPKSPQPAEYEFLLRVEGQLKKAVRDAESGTETMLALRMVTMRLNFWRKDHVKNSS